MGARSRSTGAIATSMASDAIYREIQAAGTSESEMLCENASKTPVSTYVRRFARQLSAPAFDLPGNLLFGQQFQSVLNRAQPNFDQFFFRAASLQERFLPAATFEFSNLLDTFPIMAKLVSLRDGKPRRFDYSLCPLSGQVASAPRGSVISIPVEGFPPPSSRKGSKPPALARVRLFWGLTDRSFRGKALL